DYLSGPELMRHVVLLRRLANPYLPESPTNPYLTVDSMDYVPAFDAVIWAVGQGQPRGPGNGLAKKGSFDPIGERFAVGKVQPYAGPAVATLTPDNPPTYGPLS